MGPHSLGGVRRVFWWARALWAHTLWAHTLWAHTLWAHTLWTHTLWAHTLWAHTVWAHTLWAHTLWAHQPGTKTHFKKEAGKYSLYTPEGVWAHIVPECGPTLPGGCAASILVGLRPVGPHPVGPHPVWAHTLWAHTLWAHQPGTKTHFKKEAGEYSPRSPERVWAHIVPE